MNKDFDLNKYINDNYDTIMECKKKNIPFEWDEDAAIAVYKIAKDSAGKLNIAQNKYADFLQDCVMHFFTYMVYKYDTTRNIAITTFMYHAFANLYRMEKKKEKTKNYKQTYSLDAVVYTNNEGDGIELIDTIENSEPTQLEQLEQKEFYAFLREKLNEDEALYKFFVNEKSQSKVAEEIGISQAQVSRRIKNKLNEIRQEWDGKNPKKMEHRK